MIFKRMKRTVKEERAEEQAQAAIEKQAALLEYVAAMADIDLPDEEESEEKSNE